PHKDVALRATIAVAAAEGRSLTSDQIDYLYRLQRPLYLVTYQADDPARFTELTKQYGASLFHQGFIAGFKFAMPSVTASEKKISHERTRVSKICGKGNCGKGGKLRGDQVYLDRRKCDNSARVVAPDPPPTPHTTLST